MRILIVEDDVALARGLSSSLKALGFAVDCEADGAEAASIALSEPYSLIILDLGLPGSSGFDILRRVRRSGSKKTRSPATAGTIVTIPPMTMAAPFLKNPRRGSA